MNQSTPTTGRPELVVHPVPEELKSITPRPAATDPSELYTPSGSHVKADRRIWPLWLQYLTVAAVGTLVLGLPALLIFLTQNRQVYIPIISQLFDVRIAEVYRWSILIASTHCAYYLTLAFVAALPSFVEGIFLLMRRDTTLQLGAYSFLKRMLLIRTNWALFAASLTMWILVTVYFTDVAPETNMLISNRLSEFYLVRAAFALVIFSGLLIVEKVLIQKVAMAYHSDYYADRIEENMFAVSAIRRLRRKYPSARGGPQLILTSVDGEEEDEAIHELAEGLFRGLCSGEPTRDTVVLEDFKKGLAAQDAQRLYGIIDQDNNGDVSLREFEEFLQHLYNERDLLSQCLSSNDQLLARLDSLGFAIVVAVTAAMCLPIFNVSWATGIFTSITSLIAVKAFFESSILSIFDTIVFIFVSHPFDAGDVVLLDGIKYKVKHIGWWQSSFYGDGNTLVYLANNTLNGMCICNFRRSGPQEEEFALEVHPKTTDEQVHHLQEAIAAFVGKNQRDFLSLATVNVNQLVNRDALKLTAKVTHRSNFQQGAIKFRRSCLMAQGLRSILKDLKISLAGDQEPFSMQA